MSRRFIWKILRSRLLHWKETRANGQKCQQRLQLGQECWWTNLEGVDHEREHDSRIARGSSVVDVLALTGVVANVVAVETLDAEAAVQVVGPDGDDERDDPQSADEEAVEEEIHPPPEREDGLVGLRGLEHGVPSGGLQWKARKSVRHQAQHRARKRKAHLETKGECRRSGCDGVDEQGGDRRERVDGVSSLIFEGEADDWVKDRKMKGGQGLIDKRAS